jgi:hydrogenase nickel incorporation protein HypA/HybF
LGISRQFTIALGAVVLFGAVAENELSTSHANFNMHELSIAMSILDVAGEEMEHHGGVQVEAIHIRLGPLAGVVKEALLSAYEIASERTPFEHARLVIEDVPIVVYCSKCQAERPGDAVHWFCCSVCGTTASQVLHGRELELAALELE